MIELGDPVLAWEESLTSTTVRMMREISLKIDQHIIDTLLRPAFEAGSDYGVDLQLAGYWGDSPTEPDFDEWLAGFIADLGGRESDE